MNNKTKALLLLLCAVAVVAAAAFGTLAYLTDKDANVNTFTVGKVGLKLDEADVNPDGTLVEGADRVQENEYHLIPGHTYIKDPTVTMDAGSEDAYVRMMVKVENIEQLMRALPQAETIIGEDGTTSRVVFPDNQKYYGKDDIFLLQNLCVDESGALTWDNTKWEFKTFHKTGTYTNCYEFRYYTTADDKSGPAKDGVLEPLFTKITVPGEIDNDHLANLRGIEINVTAHAIQAAGFGNADDAWTAFDTQMNPTA